MNTNIIKIIQAGTLLLASLPVYALPAVVIKTYGQHIGGNIVYTHLITNNSLEAIDDLAIALDTNRVNHMMPTVYQGELTWAPLGAVDYFGPEPVPITGEVSPGSVSGLPGWHAEIIQIEDSGLFMQWYSHPHEDLPTNPPSVSIAPGQTVRFGLTADKFCYCFLTSHFSAAFSGWKMPSHHNGRMERLDTTPPVLSVTLTPATITAAQRGQMIPVTATITVKDDYDPAPEIKLVSVLADDPANGSDIQGDAVDTDDRSFSVRAARFNPAIARTYQVVYSATDASGNTSTATVNLLVN